MNFRSGSTFGAIASLVFFVLSGCSTLGAIDQQKYDEITSERVKMELDGYDPSKVIALSNQLLELSANNNVSKYRSEARTLLKNALAQYPNDLQLARVLYAINYSAVMNWEAPIETLYEAYEYTDEEFQERANPPGLALYLRDLNLVIQGSYISDETLKSHLAKALKEAPKNPDVKLWYARFLTYEQKYLQAIAIYEDVQKIAPDNPQVVRSYASAYESYIASEECPYESKSKLKKATSLAQEALRLNPKEMEVYENAFLMFRRVGSRALVSNLAKSIDNEFDHRETRRIRADAMFFLKDYEKARDLYRYLAIRDYGRDGYDYSIFLASQGEWSESHAVLEKSIKHFRPGPYGYLMYNVISRISGHTDYLSYDRVINSLSAEQLGTPGVSQLLQYWYGVISEEELFNASQNICQTVEANFYVAVQKALSGEYDEALSMLELVRDSSMHTFKEVEIVDGVIDWVVKAESASI